MKGLKIIAALSFVLVFYPILAVPVKYKEWIAAALAFSILLVSLALIYIFSEEDMEASAEDNIADAESVINEKLEAKKDKNEAR